MYKFKAINSNNQKILSIYNVHITVYRTISIKYVFKNYFSDNLK